MSSTAKNTESSTRFLRATNGFEGHLASRKDQANATSSGQERLRGTTEEEVSDFVFLYCMGDKFLFCFVFVNFGVSPFSGGWRPLLLSPRSLSPREKCMSVRSVKIGDVFKFCYRDCVIVIVVNSFLNR